MGDRYANATKHPTAEHSIADDIRYFRRPGKRLGPYHRNSRAMHVRGAVDDIVAAIAAYIVRSMTPPPSSSIEAEDVVDEDDERANAEARDVVDSSGPRSSRSSSGEQCDVGAGKRERVMMGMTIIYMISLLSILYYVPLRRYLPPSRRFSQAM